MKHFIDIAQLSRDEILSLIARANHFKVNQAYHAYRQCSLANLFYENSTRTRISFEMAANNLCMSVVNLNLEKSSESKGEVIEDAILNLAAMGIKFFVVRHHQAGIPQLLADTCGHVASIINAGDGTNAHPSQAMLDIMTILEKRTSLEKLKIAIVGNVSHSRVAHSFQYVSERLGVGELMLVAPVKWQPKTPYYGKVTDSLEEGLSNADVVMCLRVQRERLLDDEHLDLAIYRQDYAITKNTLSYAKPDAIVMHPGPMNRGVEIDSDIADGPQSVILEQVKNGVFMRMAILTSLIEA